MKLVRIGNRLINLEQVNCAVREGRSLRVYMAGELDYLAFEGEDAAALSRRLLAEVEPERKPAPAPVPTDVEIEEAAFVGSLEAILDAVSPGPDGMIDRMTLREFLDAFVDLCRDSGRAKLAWLADQVEDKVLPGSPDGVRWDGDGKLYPWTGDPTPAVAKLAAAS